ncbi:calcium/sodium antiporter [Thiothrix subterranea]|uniref:Calcium/sodium antiporter n=1 Tax=Thiothrix subterranea TaxID=2735563 RepID=A0AA51MM21_9GAMM|nr:calcium/sodium antiporter [Thiothrix subterranea]MDQ5768675.1 calcium/sodium antiporter [Thiothrix subterranea]WML84827.1 calcium/sodium antiporter [Thiothrix subterranea]
MLLFSVAILVGLVLLAWSSERFVDGASSLARHWGIPPLVVGIVVVGFGTSAPEMLVSLTAAMQGNPGIALGNAVGSNITNIALVLGVTALLMPLSVHSRVVKRELPLVLLAGLFSWVLLRDGSLSQWDGILLVSTLVGLLGWMVHTARAAVTAGDDTLLQEIAAEMPATLSQKYAILWTVLGLLVLILSSRLLVWGATGIAQAFGVSDLIIGLTIVAIGTSLPELAASIASVRKGESDMAVGNIVGSNLFNNLAVIGLPALLSPIAVPDDFLSRDLPIMLGLTVLLLLFNFTPPKRNVIARPEGAVLLLAFIAYQILLYTQST